MIVFSAMDATASISPRRTGARSLLIRAAAGRYPTCTRLRSLDAGYLRKLHHRYDRGTRVINSLVIFSQLLAEAVDLKKSVYYHELSRYVYGFNNELSSSLEYNILVYLSLLTVIIVVLERSRYYFN